MPQERMPKTKSDERRVEIKLPKIQKENDADVLFSSIKKEPECVIIENDSDEYSDTSAHTFSEDDDTRSDSFWLILKDSPNK